MPEGYFWHGHLAESLSTENWLVSILSEERPHRDLGERGIHAEIVEDARLSSVVSMWILLLSLCSFCFPLQFPSLLSCSCADALSVSFGVLGISKPLIPEVDSE